MTSIIAKPLTRFRTASSRGAKPRVERTGGDYGAGVIYGVSAITVGEALGHYAWIDQLAIEQVVSFGNKSKSGVKSRFTHPGLSSDGMGTLLGRMKSWRVEGDRALNDLHFQKSAHNTPDGDLATYVMDMAEEDPEAFGTSIVFDHDRGEEDRFTADNEDEDGNFHSPDEANGKNYPHIRLSKLLADDVVDDPAANPGGLFRQGHEIADEADRLCEFALGLSSDRPALQHLSADADRLASFAARFLDSHNLEVRKKEMGTESKTTEAPAAITTELLSTTLSAFGEKLLAQVDAKLAALKPGEKPAETPSVADIEKRGAERLSQLTALAASAGVPEHEKIGKTWFDQGLSVADATAAIKPLMVSGNQLSKDAGGSGDADPDAKYRAEYQKQQAAFMSMGLTLDEYVSSRKIDDGKSLLAPETTVAA